MQPQRLTTDGRFKTDPVFVQEGRAIVFNVQEDAKQLALMRLTLEDGKVERVRPEATTSEFEIAYSADERVYAYQRNVGNLAMALIIHDERAGTTVEHSPGGGFSGLKNPSVSPDGRRVIYAYPEQDALQQIFSVRADGEDRRALSDGPGHDTCPRYSPDGRLIAFSSSRGGNFDIWVMSADGTGARQVTDHRSLDTRPAWSPDGKRLAFTSLRDGNYEIYMVNLDGTGLTRITDHPDRDDYPTWHPDGRHLAMVCERGGKFDLYLVEVGS